jgi:hypothetical protein
MQEQASKDMYGINGAAEITDEALLIFQDEIQKIPEKSAYDTAMNMSSSYVQDKRFRLMFLRACQGDAKKAAKRITRHFSTKENLFGREKLVKDIELSDLDEYDMEALESGGFQVLPKRDLAGRNVLFGRYTAMKYREIKNMVSGMQISGRDVEHSVLWLIHRLSCEHCGTFGCPCWKMRSTKPKVWLPLDTNCFGYPWSVLIFPSIVTLKWMVVRVALIVSSLGKSSVFH